LSSYSLTLHFIFIYNIYLAPNGEHISFLMCVALKLHETRFYVELYRVLVPNRWFWNVHMLFPQNVNSKLKRILNEFESTVWEFDVSQTLNMGLPSEVKHLNSCLVLGVYCIQDTYADCSRSRQADEVIFGESRNNDAGKWEV
jgi:hypothetical protein